jgi:hypothetical protein
MFQFRFLFVLSAKICADIALLEVAVIIGINRMPEVLNTDKCSNKSVGEGRCISQTKST